MIRSVEHRRERGPSGRRLRERGAISAAAERVVVGAQTYTRDGVRALVALGAGARK
jgi:hypothetical protein